MPTGAVHAATRMGARRRVALTGLALGVSSLLAVGGSASSASAQAPAAVVHCQNIPSDVVLGATVSDFPPNEGFLWFAYAHHDGFTATVDGLGINTDSTGAGTTDLGTGGLPTGASVPIKIGFAVYRDINANFRWDSGDDTIFSGDGTITDCPQDVTLAPK